MTISESEVLQLAIEGYKSRIAELETRLGELKGGTPTAKPIVPKGRRTMSAAARKRISEAQKKRHAAEKAAKLAAAAKPKRKMSAAQKKAIIANLAKARAATAKKAGG